MIHFYVAHPFLGDNVAFARVEGVRLANQGFPDELLDKLSKPEGPRIVKDKRQGVT